MHQTASQDSIQSGIKSFSELQKPLNVSTCIPKYPVKENIKAYP